MVERQHLPLYRAFGGSQASAEPAAARQPSILGNIPVLVVDDNATNRRILKEALANWGMLPTLAEGAAPPWCAWNGRKLPVSLSPWS